MIRTRDNVLLVISKFPPEYSGPGVRIPRLYQWLEKRKPEKYTLRVLCNGIEQTQSHSYHHDGIPTRRIVADWTHSLFSFLPFFPSKYKHAILYQIEFVKTLFILFIHKDYRNIDLLHLAGHSGGTAAALVWAHKKKVPVLMELVTANAPYRQKFFFFFKTPILNHIKIISLTNDMHDKCVKAGLSSSKIWCRPNPIDEIKFCFVDDNEKQRFKSSLSPFSNNKIVLVSVAKMMPQKNQILIINALKYLPDNFVALIGGPLIKQGPLQERDQKYLQDIEELIDKLKLKERVHLVTDFVNAEDYMKAGDIYMMPAWNEGFGTPMIEAMGCGLPVIGNKDEPAFQEWIHNNKTGYLCDITSPKEWATAIEKLSKLSQKQRLEISKNIHKKAGQKAIYNHYEDVINQLISKK